MKFACYIFGDHQNKSRLYGPFDDIREATEAGMMASAGSPEDPVNQGDWDETVGVSPDRVLVSDARGVPVFMAMPLETGQLWLAM